MENPAALQEILSSFTTATEAALQGLPVTEAILPPKDGISLLDAKNEIFLSYLQALALRNLNVIQSLKEGESLENAQRLSNDVTAKLVEHRVYLERGVRPLEQKINYMVDKAVKAANDEDQALARKSKRGAVKNGHANGENEDESESGQDTDENDETAVGADADDLYRPNAAAIVNRDQEQDRRAKGKADGVYKPPRISATAMPTTEQRERKERKPARSATLDEYVSTELSHAPMAEPSIGSTIAAGGRTNKDARQLAKEKERRQYEETNLVRLPKESKKDSVRKGARDLTGGFGGEEWRGLDASVDRIGDLTRRKGKVTALDKSRKRRDVGDGPRGGGIGEAFDVKKRRLMKKMHG